MLDCINKETDLIDYAIELGLCGVAITDHEALGSHVKAISYLKSLKEKAKEIISNNNQEKIDWANKVLNFKLGLGNEIYLCRDGLNKENYVKGEDGFFHFILIAKDKIGHKQLRELSSRAWSHSFRQFIERVPTYYKDIEDIVGENKGHLIASTACFPKGQLVLTSTGYKRIEDISSGELVLTSNGWEKVNFPTSRLWNKDFVKIKASHGFEDEIIATENHKFLAISPNKSGLRQYGTFNKDFALKIDGNFNSYDKTEKIKYYCQVRNIKENWIEAKDLKVGDYVFTYVDERVEEFKKIETTFIPSAKYHIKNTINIDNEFCELIGIWLAEGSWNNKTISFTIHSEEEDFKNRIIYLMEKVFGLDNAYIYKRKKTKAQTISYSSVELNDVFEKIFGCKSKEINQWNKWIPWSLKLLTPTIQLQIVKGWMMGDGYYQNRNEQGKRFVGATVSKQLAQDLKFILNRNFINPCYDISKEHGIHKESYYLSINGKIAQSLKNCILQNVPFTINPKDRGQKDLPCLINGKPHLHNKITQLTKISNEKETQVYCLNVGETHNFSVSGIIVKNCLGGFFPKLLTEAIDNNDYRKVNNFVNWCSDIFGDDFYIEVQASLSEEQMDFNANAVKYARSKGIKVIVTTDTHYLKENDRPIHKAFLNSSDGDREVDDFYAYTYLMNYDEILDKLSTHLPLNVAENCLKNTLEIYDKVEEYDFARPQTIPRVPIDWTGIEKITNHFEGYTYINNFINSTEDNQLYISKIIKGLKEKNIFDKRHLDRIEIELEQIWKISQNINENLSNYFLTMEKVLNIIWASDSIVGDGRGSAATHLCSYCLNIIQYDPLESPIELPWWRFLSSERPELPKLYWGV